MSTRILIVDPNESFAQLLKEGLEADREFQAVAASTGALALAALETHPFDLAIIDLGIADPEPAALLRAIRDRRPDLPLMVIPFFGDIVPETLTPFDIKGVLPKPFFLPELPAHIAEVLGRPIPMPAPTPAPPVPDNPAHAWQRMPARALPRIKLPPYDVRVSDALQSLSDVLNAEAVLLTEGNLLTALAGPISQADADTLARSLLESGAMRNTHREQVRFDQSIPARGERLLYSLHFAEGFILTAAVRPDSSLRIIRAQTRQTANALIALGR
jgi:DNA-binding response OmpR family regulator